MESNLYNRVLNTNKNIYSTYSEEYLERTKNGHANYLQGFIDRFISSLSGNIVYDLGCGPGRDLEYFTKHNLKATGVDCSTGMLEICRNKGLDVIENDFMSMEYPEHSVDGIWAYTSHTVIPKESFTALLEKYQKALKENSGILALGMIEGDFEGWKSDNKYDGAQRYVARYSFEELEHILKSYFGSVSISREKVGNKVYLHCICKNTPVAKREDTVNAAKNIFNKFSDQYLQNTQTGIKLLEDDRKAFIELLKKNTPVPKILDIGCGPGRDLVQLKNLGAEVMGLDISESNVKNCKAQGVDAIIGDIYKLNEYFKENSFDGVWCNCSVTNWILREDLPKVFNIIKSIVKPGGYIFIGSVLGNFVGWEIDSKYEQMKRYNNHWDEAELRKYLALLGDIKYEHRLDNTGKKNYLNVVLINE